MTRTAAVVIGRNEGPRLARCLRSVVQHFDPVVYVDSDSSDGSRDVARSLAADVVELDLSIPFTFGRGRNTGAARALELAPDAALVQFVDADSEIAPGWHDAAVRAFDGDPRLGAVHGRVRERSAAGTLYDRMFELEFDPRTEADHRIGGMAMLRVEAYLATGRYVEGMRSFEDHELSFRLRNAGWQVRRLDADMAIHEADMTRWRDWWKREQRNGQARAELIALHGLGGERDWTRACASNVFWAAGIPAAAAITTARFGAGGLLIALAYPAFVYRVFRRMRGRGFGAADAALYGAARLASKFPQLHGMLTFLREARTGTGRRRP